MTFSISTVYCLHDFTYALLHASRQPSIMCFVSLTYIYLFPLAFLFNFWRWQFLDAFFA